MTAVQAGETTRVRGAVAVVWASWPVGFVLIAAHTLGGLLSNWAFALLALGYSVVLWLAARSLSAGADRTSQLMVHAGPMVFVLAGLTRPPTAEEPAMMLLNAAVLAAAAVMLLVAATRQVLDRDRLDRAAVFALLAIVIGSGVWLISLVSRWAVVLSGGSALQLDVEGSAWMANVYLRGLAGDPSFMSYLLVLMDLLQLTYLVLCYLGFGLLSRTAAADGLVAPRTGRVIGAVSLSLAGVVLVSAAAAAWVGSLGLVAAWTAFVLTIPFMSTLVPYLLGGAMLTAARRR